MKSTISFLILSLGFALFSISCGKDTANEPDIAQTTIKSIFPINAKGGQTITISGNNLLKDSTGLRVLINKIPASILSATNETITVKIPQRAGSGTVQITAGGKTYDGPELTYDYLVVVSTIAGNGFEGNADGIGTGASFKFPFGITVDNNGDIYVADCYNRLIRKIDTATRRVSTIDIPFFTNGWLFASPYNLAIDTISKSLYVTDFNRHLLKITAAGEKSVILNNDSMVLAGIGIGSDRRLYISNNTSGQLIRVDTNGQNRTVFSSGLVTPLNIFFDKEGGMYVTGAAIYKIAADGTYIQAIPPPSQFTGWEATLGHNGIFYETDNERHFIRRINKDGSRTIIAGNGVAADIDGIGMDSSFDSPIGITSDKDGNLYVTNYNFTTRTGNRIRKVSFY